MATDKKIPSNLVFSKEKFRYNTIQDVINDTGLTVGLVVETDGYNTLGDGAGHKRKISNEDDGSGVQLKNGLWANIVHNGKINVSWFGAKPNIDEDQSQAIQKAINYSIDKKLKLNISKMYTINNSLEINNALLLNGYSNSDITLENGSGFIFNNNCLKINNARNVTINNITFKQNIQNKNVSAIDITGNCSKLTLFNCNFYDITGYCINFVSPTYSQMLSFKNISCWNTGGVIGGTGELNDVGQKGLVCTSAVLENINLDDSVNQTSPCNPILDLIGFREYVLTGVVLEGRNGNNGTAVRIGNSQWNIVKGVHIEFKNNVPVTGTEVAQNLNTVSNSSNIRLYSPAFPILISANYCNVFIEGIYRYYLSGSAYTITGKGSTLNINNQVFGEYKYNVFNLNDIGKINYSNISVAQTTNYLPTTLQPYIELFKWSSSDGDLLSFSNQYFYVQIIGDIKTKGIVNTSDIGYVYEVIPNTNTMPIVAFRFKDVSKFVDKRVTISITYRLVTSATRGLDKIQVVNYMSDVKEIGLINSQIVNDVAIASCCLIPNEKTNGFISNNSSDLDAPITLQIIGVTIVQGNTTIATPLQFVDNSITQLNSIYHLEKMKQENVYDDYITYMDEKTAYDKKQEKLKQERQLSYQEALKENPNLTYEEFMSLQPMTLNLIEEPQPSDALKKFMEKYL